MRGADLKRPVILPYLLLSLTVLFWSGNFVLGRGIRDLIAPVSLNFYRWLGALVILLPFGLPRVWRQRRLLLRHWKMIALMSIPAIVCFNAFIYNALQTTTAINTTLVNAMTPIFIALLAWLMFREKLGWRQLLGVIISFCGLIYIVVRGDWTILMTLTLSLGDLWTLGAAISWATYSVMLRKRPANLDPVAFLTTLIGFGLVLSLPWYLWELKIEGGFALSWNTMASVAYVALFPSVLSYIFWNRGVQQVGANRAGIFIHLMPVFSIFLAIGFLDERLSAYHLAGIGLIFTGIALTTWPQKQ